MKGIAILVAVGLMPTFVFAQEVATVPDTVTLEWLQGVFRHAYVDAQIDGDGDLQLTEGGGVTLWLQLDEQRRLVNFFTVGTFRAEADYEKKLAFVNDLNGSIIGATFYLARDNLMIADAYLSYDGGVSDHRVMSSYRWFRDAVHAAIRRDEDGLLGDRARIRPTVACQEHEPGCVRVKT
jgi:hypothetical protein